MSLLFIAVADSMASTYGMPGIAPDLLPRELLAQCQKADCVLATLQACDGTVSNVASCLGVASKSHFLITAFDVSSKSAVHAASEVMSSSPDMHMNGENGSWVLSVLKAPLKRALCDS